MNNVTAPVPTKDSPITTQQVYKALDSRLRRFQENLTLLAKGVNAVTGSYYEPIDGSRFEVVSQHGSGFTADLLSGMDALESQLDAFNNMVTRLNETTKTGLYTEECDAKYDTSSNSCR